MQIKKSRGIVRYVLVQNGCVAQLVEQLTLNQWVWGSNPHAPTNKGSPLFSGLFLLVKRSVRRFEPQREGFDYQRKAGGRTPVGKADERLCDEVK